MNCFYLVLLLCVVSCNSNREQGPDITGADSSKLEIDTVYRNERNISQEELNKLFDVALEKGDRSAYNKASSYCFLNMLYNEVFPYALIMANKNNDPAAYFDVYDVLQGTSGNHTLKGVDERTKSIASYYLLRSYELGNVSAKAEVEEIFIKNKRPVPKSDDFLIFKKGVEW
jgi:hypothetical protein